LGLDVLNGRPTDSFFADPDPDRTEEALQAWDGVKSLYSSLSNDPNEIRSNLEILNEMIVHARVIWSEIQAKGFSNEISANFERLSAMEDGITLFKKWAEISG